MPVLVTKTIHGRRAVPIDREALDKMLKTGTARKVNTGGLLYEEIADGKETQSREEAAEEVLTQSYQTKVMEAETPKKRGRPVKVSADVSADPS